MNLFYIVGNSKSRGDNMKDKNHSKKDTLDFSKITPGMQIQKIRFNKLYKKAFIDADKLPESEYARNTSAED